MLYILFFDVFKLSKCTGVRNVFRHCLLDCRVTALPHWLVYGTNHGRQGTLILKCTLSFAI